MNETDRTITPTPDHLGSPLVDCALLDHPKEIGRYRVQRLLGKGGFGLVYLAHDEQLERLVAIKVPHAQLIAETTDAEAYLTEARTVANLDHPNIVPVYDAGGTELFPCFIVSKYIDGTDLATRLKQSRLSIHETVALVATVAEALHHAHKQGLVHRDVKPGNILLDKSGKPFVADFGLALREQDVGKGPRFAGTPAYMSPEQARGEGHRVDGRVDIFSLGVVFYELLTGRRPFNGTSTAELLEQVTVLEPRPPRQIDDQIPKELERICLKALAKRASERYSTAQDMADDLRHWIASLDAGRIASRPGSEPVVAPEAAAPGLSKDVFFSYASPDQQAAFRLCRLLEDQGIGCWIALRDVAPGADHGEAIIRAIETSATTVLLLSASANASVHVKHEVECATSKRKRVIPVRLEDVLPGPALELHLATAHWLDAFRLSPEEVAAQLASVLREGAMATPSFPADTPPLHTPKSEQPLKIVPKGLRSFDAGDADFFLELLPGPRDRDGLPDSIRFWKTRIEEMDAERTFSVGLIYGPSGCGKSSLMKAGLLPRLAQRVIAIHVEATANDTEARLLRGLRKSGADLPANLGLKESLSALRRGQGTPAGKKVLIVLDQFEQWLHAKGGDANSELVQALRHCDGGRVQCIVLVRDDFGMAATRFMKALEVEIMEGRNFATVDLFDLLHARKVLTGFGRAFGRLPDDPGRFTREQESFLDQAVAGLAQESKVISVRLALFAEMVKGKPWTPATLKEVGGAEGVGVTFLEDTFASRTANPTHRLHQKAAQAVLKMLLPETGSDIKGNMRSRQELLEGSGYAAQVADFDELLRILDSELRLITPTDPEGKADSAAVQTAKAYQLTHDYLVPSLRDWLTRKQKETRRGRAELLLADRAAVWNARPENRQLPTFLQWLRIKWLTQKKNWTLSQRKMMRKATRYHAVRAAVVGLILALVGLVSYEGNGRLQAYALRDRLLDADTHEVPTIVRDMAPYRRWIDRLLREATVQAEATNDARQQLHASLALLPVDATQVNYLYGRLLDAGPHEVPVIRDALAPYRGELVDKLWAVVHSPEKGKESQRLRAAAALAKYDPDSKEWAKVQDQVANDLVGVPIVYSSIWIEALRDVREKMQAPLAVICRDGKRRETERSLATDILTDYAADRLQVLADLLMDAEETQFAAVFPRFNRHGERGSTVLIAEINKKLAPEAPASDASREKLAKRQANAAVALFRMDQAEKVWPLLRHSPDPRVRSYLIHRFGLLGADARAIVKRLDEETDVTIQRALVLSLGGFTEKGISVEERKAVTPKLQEMYRAAADPGLHGASEWLLRSWKLEDWVRKVNEGWKNDTQQQAKRLEEIRQTLAREKASAKPQWYVTGQGQTMAVIPGPVEFMMGSPPHEVDRFPDEFLHRRRIPRSFALAMKEVTVGEFERFLQATGNEMELAKNSLWDDKNRPVTSTSWLQAVRYCRWLSDQENISEDQMCYPALAQLTMDKVKNGLQLPRDFLEREGYRLPTEAEWEYACRAGATTSRSFGSDNVMLCQYGWHIKNSDDHPWPVGLLKPNEFGLFDMYGNAWEWCQTQKTPYPRGPETEVADDGNHPSLVKLDNLVMRGGAFGTHPANVRSARRYPFQVTYLSVGLRVARTIRPCYANLPMHSRRHAPFFLSPAGFRLSLGHRLPAPAERRQVALESEQARAESPPGYGKKY